MPRPLPYGAAFPNVIEDLEHRVGIEPTYTGFADLRVTASPPVLETQTYL